MTEVCPLMMSQKQNPESARHHSGAQPWRSTAPPPGVARCLHAQDAYRCLSPAITLLIMPTLLEIIAEK